MGAPAFLKHRRFAPSFLRGLGGGALEVVTGFPPDDPFERVFALPAPRQGRERLAREPA